jgi:Kae1-associated kinase Bud32
MEHIIGIQLKKLLDKDPKLAILIGKNLSIMHDLNIIHGDLTTSNMILTKDKKLYFIDFGLSFNSSRIEDKAVDIHLFKQALESKHFRVNDKAYKYFLQGYNPKDKKEILERLAIAETRGRYKEKT